MSPAAACPWARCSRRVPRTRALTDAGLRGQADIVVDGADLLDVHTAAMTLASGASAVVPWLAIELAAELAGTRGAEDVTAEAAIANLLRAFEAGLRKVLARMGISTAASYLGGQLFEVLELEAEVTQRCFPAAPTWPGTVGFRTIAARQLRRLAAAPVEGPGVKLHDPGWARFRSDGERHLYAPPIVKAVQDLAARGAGDPEALPAYREALARDPATVRDQLALVNAPAPRHITEVEDATRILRRFVGSAMSLGALSPGGAPGADHRPAAAGHGAQHRRGRRGPRVVRRHRRLPARRGHQAGRIGALRGHREVPRPRRAARDQDRPGLQARRGRPAARRRR